MNTMQKRKRSEKNGFTLIEMLGVLAILAILGGLLAPQFIQTFKRDLREAETRNLEAIAHGVEVSLRENRAWPANLAALSPAYVPFSSTQLTQNARGFPRYYVVHPTVSSFSNGAGLAASDLDDVRFLLISNLTADASPTITTGAQFDTWWNTDETGTPDLKIYRGNLGHVFHLVSVSSVGVGGSYQIDGTSTNSGGGTLAVYSRYHLVGTPGGLDEANTYVTPELQWTSPPMRAMSSIPIVPAATSGRFSGLNVPFNIVSRKRKIRKPFLHEPRDTCNRCCNDEGYNPFHRHYAK